MCSSSASGVLIVFFSFVLIPRGRKSAERYSKNLKRIDSELIFIRLPSVYIPPSPWGTEGATATPRVSLHSQQPRVEPVSSRNVSFHFSPKSSRSQPPRRLFLSPQGPRGLLRSGGGGPAFPPCRLPRGVLCGLDRNLLLMLLQHELPHRPGPGIRARQAGTRPGHTNQGGAQT